MGELLRLGDTADVEPGRDVLDAVQGWLDHARSGAIGRPLSAILVLEDNDGRLFHASTSALSRCDLARKLGLMEMASARMRMDAGRLMDEPSE